MQFQDFRALVERLSREVPSEYLEGIVDIEASPKTVPHPLLGGVYTLGECIPLETGADLPPSRVVLYHGSFQALARDRQDFDWRKEAWETLTHELRHHLEWRANTKGLEQYDWAAEQNFRRLEGEPFDVSFYLAGERLADGVFQVEDDVFWDRSVRRAPEAVEIEWHGRRYRVKVPAGDLPMYLVLQGLHPPPAGEAVVAVRRKPRFSDLWRRLPRATVHSVNAEPVN